MKIATLLTASFALAGPVEGPATIPAVAFEKEPHALHGGKPARSPKIISRRAQGLLAIYTAPAARGADLYFTTSADLGESWSEPQRINNVPGEVSDHGENSAQLLLSPDEMTLYAFWNARDPQNPGASHVRFSKGGAMMTTWSPAVTLDDDPVPNSHGFQGAGVAPDGTLFAAWLDQRDKEAAKTGDYTAGAATVYLTRSTDGGRTWVRNIAIAQDVCPCCRVSFGFVAGRVVVSWRGVVTGDFRDIFTSVSSDNGQTWSKPTLVSRDGWKIKGCPHVGAAMAAVNGRLHIVWYTEAQGKPGIFVASTTNGSEFTPKRLVSTGTADPTHPFVNVFDDRLAIAFQARDGREKDSWGKMSIYYRELLANGTLSPLQRAGLPGAGTVTYPSLALGMSGRTFLAWTESGENGPKAMLLRGRAR
ncbi:MAG: exo-alpha-sialidase [Acidobacteria bacterium]|nr:exo-alpha-sialidase [Acidobacteriota bacterium]